MWQKPMGGLWGGRRRVGGAVITLRAKTCVLLLLLLLHRVPGLPAGGHAGMRAAGEAAR